MRTPCRSRDLAEPNPAAGRKPTSTAGGATVLHKHRPVEGTRMFHKNGPNTNGYEMRVKEDGMEKGAARGDVWGVVLAGGGGGGAQEFIRPGGGVGKTEQKFSLVG